MAGGSRLRAQPFDDQPGMPERPMFPLDTPATIRSCSSGPLASDDRNLDDLSVRVLTRGADARGQGHSAS